MDRVLAQARQLASLGPAEKDHLHAGRVAIGLVVPGIALLLAGRPDLIIYAVFGSFTGMYGRAETPRLRLRHQSQAAVVLIVGSGLGILLSGIDARPWLLVLAEVVFATITSVVTDRLGLRPEGPFFGMFALGALATVPPERVAAWVGLWICVATALFALFVTFVVGKLRAHYGRLDPNAEAVSRPQTNGVGIHAVRYGVAVAAAGGVGVLLGMDHANWATAAAAVPLASASARSRVGGSMQGVVHRSIHRVVGTFVGLGVTALLLLPNLSATWLAILVMALLFPTELFMARHYGMALGFFTPLIMLMTELAEPSDPMTLLIDRGIDTVIGVIAGLSVALLIQSNRSQTRPAPKHRLQTASGSRA
ncbi:FUSC family protein [Skermania sp. ID1734]|uniref:FUSC family protein n=1 Tax=Skermania sp. ID1734 TaxID=2597516 RepID=UPI0011801189|nr:FUSC family protein [Skermania sp. ID1734]TSD98133.1 FUSC family protein [Skermania sp. ID1734]